MPQPEDNLHIAKAAAGYAARRVPMPFVEAFDLALCGAYLGMLKAATRYDKSKGDWKRYCWYTCYHYAMDEFRADVTTPGNKHAMDDNAVRPDELGWDTVTRCPSPGPAEIVEADDTRAYLLQAMQPDDARCIEMRLRGMRNADIARVVGQSRQRITQRVQRAQKTAMEALRRQDRQAYRPTR